jgi:hypothetical protein
MRSRFLTLLSAPSGTTYGRGAPVDGSTSLSTNLSRTWRLPVDDRGDGVDELWTRGNRGSIWGPGQPPIANISTLGSVVVEAERSSE